MVTIHGTHFPQSTILDRKEDSRTWQHAAFWKNVKGMCLDTSIEQLCKRVWNSSLFDAKIILCQPIPLLEK